MESWHSTLVRKPYGCPFRLKLSEPARDSFFNFAPDQQGTNHVQMRRGAETVKEFSVSASYFSFILYEATTYPNLVQNLRHNH